MSDHRVRRFLADLHRFAARVADTSKPDRDARQIAATEIARAAPHRTGRLAGSVGPDGTGVGISAPYAGVIAFGWPAHGIEANPFIPTGLDRAREGIADQYQTHVEDSLDVLDRSY